MAGWLAALNRSPFERHYAGNSWRVWFPPRNLKHGRSGAEKIVAFHEVGRVDCGCFLVSCVSNVHGLLPALSPCRRSGA